MGWESVTEILSPGVYRHRLISAEQDLSFKDVAVLLQNEPDFQLWFTDILKSAPMAAYYWETPPIARSNFDRDFEFVLIDAPSLSRLEADPAPFRGYFERATQGVVRFRNLGGDAMLIAPIPIRSDDNYAHLAVFLRSAPQAQINALWRSTFENLTKMLSTSAIWVSTSGLGVAWVHLRLDSVPKYYNHRPYMRWDQ